MPILYPTPYTGRLQIVRDAVTWNTAVAAFPAASFLQSFAWGRQKQHSGWVPVRLRVQDASTRVLLAQVLFRRIPYTPYTLGYIPRGPLLDYADDAALDLMNRALQQIARRYRAAVITWEPPLSADPLLAARLVRLGLQPSRGVQARTTRVIDLTPGLDVVAAQQHQKWRYNTRLALKHGVQVRAARDLDDLTQWYALMNVTAVRDGFGVHDLEYYRRFWLDTVDSGATTLLLAEHDGQLLAGVLIHHFGTTTTYLYGASGNDARKLMPNHLLQWEAIRWAYQRGASAYDLFGIADGAGPDEALAGVTRFKAGWGGTVVRFAGGFDSVYVPAINALVQRMRSRMTG